ncbi:unnamed protein product [Phytomonas sp. EM1]|nr:unnamed protein product [Phytomonas sp. EM1]|eukprot:CCW60553.1 unnamed protein product [Phytomonas sp. isolate EM1]
MLHRSLGPVDTNTASAVGSEAEMSKPFTGETVFPFDKGDRGMVGGEHPTYPSTILSTSLSKMNEGDKFMRDSNRFSSSRQNSDMHLRRSGHSNLEKSVSLSNAGTYSSPPTTKSSRDISYKCKIENMKSEDK